MKEEKFETSKAPNVTISECQGTVTVTGWKRSAVAVSGTGFEASMEKLDEVMIAGENNLELSVPSGASLALGEIHGSLSIKHLDGAMILKTCRANIVLSDVRGVKIGAAHSAVTGENVEGPVTIIEAMGEVSLRNVGDVQVERVHKDLALNYVRGRADVGEVGGTVDVHTINGDLKLGKVAGHANLSNLGGRNVAADIGGEIRLAGGLASGEHHFNAGGNIIVRWPVDAPLSLTASALAVVTQIHLEDKVERSDGDVTIVTGHIEEGKATVWLKTSGLIGIRAVHSMNDGAFDVEDFSFDFEAAPTGQIGEETVASPAKGAPMPDTSLLHQELTATLTTALREAGMTPAGAELQSVVAQAVSMSLEKLSLANAPASDLALADTSSGRRARSAIKRVEDSLQKVQDSMEATRQKARPPEAPGRERTVVDERKESGAPVSDERMITEEQLHILKLLEDGHITVEQAQTLLQSLQA